jgi:predicted amidohydrolase YtcJ
MDKKIKFYDSHLHLLGLGYNESLIDLNTYKSINSLLSIESNNDLILGRGWNQNSFKEKRYPNKTDLNKISSKKPIIFMRVCGHVLVCNDKAMELSNIDASSLQIEGGTFEYSTGIFTEDALSLIYSIIPSPSKKDIKEMFIKGNNILLKNNITHCASDDFSTLQVPYELIIECLTELYSDGLMQVKLYEQVNLPSKKLLLDYISKGYHKKKFNGFRMGPLKLLADGSLGGRTAYLNEPYSDDPSTRGVKVFKDEELEELIYIADSNGMDVAIHAIGDGIIDIVLDAIEKSLKQTNRLNHRHSIIHAQLANRRQIKRMKELGVSVIVQPIFLNSDIPIIEKRIGKNRAKESYLFKTMYNEGIRVGFSTDAPVEDVSPLDNIQVAMTRKSLKYPELGEFLPNEKFTYEESIECYTDNNLWLSHDDNSKLNINSIK